MARHNCLESLIEVEAAVAESADKDSALEHTHSVEFADNLDSGNLVNTAECAVAFANLQTPGMYRCDVLNLDIPKFSISVHNIRSLLFYT